MDMPAADHFAARHRVVEVSHELTVLVRPLAIGSAPCPERIVALAFDAVEGFIRFAAASEAADLASGDAGARAVLLLDEAVLVRLDTCHPRPPETSSFRLPLELRPALQALLACTVAGEAGDLYCAAKSVELLCETTRLLRARSLIPFASNSNLSEADSRRILAARQLIDQAWQEKLTLDGIASRCGLNRTRLSEGFRILFSCTVAEAIADRRLGVASALLTSTDLPIASIGYRSGYRNNASFSRAFLRRFGATPSGYRAAGLAA